jgi:hypothetical protein
MSFSQMRTNPADARGSCQLHSRPAMRVRQVALCCCHEVRRRKRGAKASRDLAQLSPKSVGQAVPQDTIVVPCSRFAPCGPLPTNVTAMKSMAADSSIQVRWAGMLGFRRLASSRLAGSLVGKNPGTRALRLRILQALLLIPLAAQTAADAKVFAYSNMPV